MSNPSADEKRLAYLRERATEKTSFMTEWVFDSDEIRFLLRLLDASRASEPPPRQDQEELRREVMRTLTEMWADANRRQVRAYSENNMPEVLQFWRHWADRVMIASRGVAETVDAAGLNPADPAGSTPAAPTTAASRSLAPEPILKGEVGEMVARFLCKTAGHNPDQPVILECSADAKALAYWKYYRAEAADLLSRLSAAREAVLEEAAKGIDSRVKWLMHEAHNGGNWDHLKARADEATYLADWLRRLKSSGSAEGEPV